MGWSYLQGIGMYVAAAVAGCGGLAAVQRRRAAKKRRGEEREPPKPEPGSEGQKPGADR